MTLKGAPALVLGMQQPSGAGSLSPSKEVASAHGKGRGQLQCQLGTLEWMAKEQLLGTGFSPSVEFHIRKISPS